MSENGTDVLPVAKEAGIEREMDILLGEIIMTSVLSSLSFTLLSDLHSFILSVQSGIESLRSGREWGIAE